MTTAEIDHIEVYLNFAHGVEESARIRMMEARHVIDEAKKKMIVVMWETPDKGIYYTIEGSTEFQRLRDIFSEAGIIKDVVDLKDTGNG